MIFAKYMAVSNFKFDVLRKAGFKLINRVRQSSGNVIQENKVNQKLNNFLEGKSKSINFPVLF